MKIWRAFGALAAVAVVVAPWRVWAAEAMALRFGFPPPATSYVNTEGMTPWIKRVEAASEGTLVIKLYTGRTLGTVRNIYARTLANVAQIGYCTLGALASLFPQTHVADLPFLSDDTKVSSVALWELYARGLLAPEFEKVKLLALFNYPSSIINTNKPIRRIADLRGMKLAVSSRVGSDTVVALGAAPVTLIPAEYYLSMDRGVVGGAFIGWTAIRTYKLQEVTKDHLDLAGGEAPAAVFMNKKAYASLPAPAKRAIDEYSGKSFSEILGANNQAAAAAERKLVSAEPDQRVSKLSAAQLAVWKKRIKPVIDSWIKQTPDGAKILAAYRQELRKIRNSK